MYPPSAVDTIAFSQENKIKFLKNCNSKDPRYLRGQNTCKRSQANNQQGLVWKHSEGPMMAKGNQEEGDSHDSVCWSTTGSGKLLLFTAQYQNYFLWEWSQA